MLQDVCVCVLRVCAPACVCLHVCVCLYLLGCVCPFVSCVPSPWCFWLFYVSLPGELSLFGFMFRRKKANCSSNYDGSTHLYFCSLFVFDPISIFMRGFWKNHNCYCFSILPEMCGFKKFLAQPYGLLCRWKDHTICFLFFFFISELCFILILFYCWSCLLSQTSVISLKVPIVIFHKFCPFPFQFGFNVHQLLRLLRYFLWCPRS